MLKTRVITAIVLLAIFLSALFYFPPSAWVVFATLVAALGAWEWGALMGLGSTARITLGGLLAIVCAVVSMLAPAAVGINTGFSEAGPALGRFFYLPAVAFWFFVVPFWLRFRWTLPKTVAGVAVGVVLLLPTWLALVQLRQAGPFALLAVMAVVWLADIAAYFFGRSFGKNKLAPTISPGKSWEGAIGGAFAVLVYGFSLAPQLPELIAGNSMLLAIGLLLLAAISVIGDLFESLLKRQAGIKDSSSILPGHGGVLDRIDSLTSTLPLVALVWLTLSY